MSIESNLYKKSIKILADLISYKTVSGQDNSELIINPLEVGTTKVKIQSTDIDGNRIDILFDVSVFNSFTEWALINNIEDNPDKYLLRYAFGKSLEISKYAFDVISKFSFSK